MAVAVNDMLHLRAPLGALDTMLMITEHSSACETVQDSYVVVTLLGGTAVEQILLKACAVENGVQVIHIERAYNGTTAVAWPVDTCGCVAALIPNAGCAELPSPARIYECGYPLDGVTAGCGITIDRTVPSAPVIRLDTSVDLVPGDYCGLVVSPCGLVASVDPNWPASCLPVFDPCSPCETGGGGSGPATAVEVVYVPRLGAQFAIGNNVQIALDQLDAGIAACCDTALAVTAGDGLNHTGPMTNRVISHLPSVLPAGTYDGFTFDIHGHVVGHTPQPEVILYSHVPDPAVNNIQITLDPLTNSYRYSSLGATTGRCGCVQLANAADVMADPVVEGDAVIRAGDFRYLVSQMQQSSPCSAEVVLAGGQSDAIVLCRGSVLKLLEWDNFAADIGGLAASGVVDLTNPVAPALSAERNVDNVSQVAVGTYNVVFSTPVTAPFHASVTLHGVGVVGFVSVHVVSSAGFTMYFRDAAGVAFDPVKVSFAVHPVA